MNLLKHKKVGFIGMGKMGQALVKTYVESGTFPKTGIFVTNRSAMKQEKVVQAYEVQSLKNNEELVEKCDIVFLCMKPQDMLEALHPISMLFNESQLVISLAAGITLDTLKKALPEAKQIVRIMPNTPVRVRKGVIGYCLSEDARDSEGTIRDLLSPLGFAVAADEGDMFEALTVTCGSGPGFIFELMMYWQDWIEEHGFQPDEARRMTVQTFLGTALIAEQAIHTDLSQLQDEVVSKKGVTYAGLESIRMEEIERLLRISFEKAVMRDKELGKTLK
ncbi:MAG: pyrroline-5-carboxylate reductase [Bdellovibrionia bacterium]